MKHLAPRLGMILVMGAAVWWGAGCQEIPLPQQTQSTTLEPDAGIRIGDDPEEADGGSDESDAGANSARPGDGWEACDLITSGGGPPAECIRVEHPILWDNPQSKLLPIFVKRLRAPEQPARGQLWLLQGGPGGSGEGLEGLALKMSERHPDLDVYVPDHRGTGRSGRLGCGREERFDSRGSALIVDEEWESCQLSVEDTWGIYLGGFTTTAAARDLGELIARFRGPGQEVYALGLSYGTYWAHRYLQLYPEQPTGLILDSLCPPGTCTMPEYDRRFNDTARDFMARCGEDDLCREKLGANPWGQMEAVFDKMERGACPQLFDMGISRETLRKTLGALMQDWALRVYIPAIIYRIERCSEDDLPALMRFAERMGLRDQVILQDAGLDSDVLAAHVMLSELWGEDAPSTAAIRAIAEGSFVSLDAAPRIAWLREAWPRYTPDALSSTWAASSAPLLMLNGTLDPQTPLEIASPAQERFQGRHQTFVVLPDAAHSTILQSPTRGGEQCGMLIADSFLDAPTQPPDLSCLADLAPIDFQGIPEYTRFFFDRDDMWENGRQKAAGDHASPAAEPPGLERLRRAIRGGLP